MVDFSIVGDDSVKHLVVPAKPKPPERKRPLPRLENSPLRFARSFSIKELVLPTKQICDIGRRSRSGTYVKLWNHRPTVLLTLEVDNRYIPIEINLCTPSCKVGQGFQRRLWSLPIQGGGGGWGDPERGPILDRQLTFDSMDQ